MCGLAGFIGGSSWSNPGAPRVLAAMLAPLAPRGPDGEGRFIDPDAAVAIGHCRLAILDLTDRAAQPMTSRCGRFVLAFNGEIYNASALARRLDDATRAACGRSDTAVFLALIARFGLDETLRSVHAMFAFALWDRETRSLTLARDPAGIKPLFMTRHGAAVAFASTTAALRPWPDFDPTLNRSGLALYARLGYWPGPHSVFQRVNKIEPGEVVTIDRDGRQTARRVIDLDAEIEAARRGLAKQSFDEAVVETDAVIEATVTEELIADRPVGVFLSGGVDSSVIAAIMAQHQPEAVQSYAAGFDDPTLDESEHAAAVAKALGLRHVTVPVTARGALEVLETIGEAFDEPLSDMAAVPTLMLARRARQDVAVVLTGDGGDEVFAGYDRYDRLLRAETKVRRVPRLARRAGASVLNGPFSAVAARMAVAAGRARSLPDADARLARLADAIGDPTRSRLYQMLVTLWADPGRLVGVEEPPHAAMAAADLAASGTLDFAQRTDLASYLPEALFVKTDRATMAHGLEARVPLAARAVTRLGLAQPEALRRHDGRLKAVLRAVAYRRVDRALIDRPKRGFSVPMGPWLRGPLRDWAESLIGPNALRAAGLFDPQMVGDRWTSHLTGKADFSYSLWAILMAQDFARRIRAGAP